MGASERTIRMNPNRVQVKNTGRQGQDHTRPNFRRGKNPMLPHNNHQRTTEEMEEMPVPGSSSTPPTLLFDRLVTEEVQELKAYARIIESQNRRLADLERIHNDLEVRLEMQTQERMDLEATLERHERGWTDKCDALTKDRDQWKRLVQTEQTKNEHLLNLVYRKDKEIHRMIQRKYDGNKQQHGHGHRDHPQRASNSSGKISSQSNNDITSSIRPSVERHMGPIKNRSPHWYLLCGTNDQAVRERGVSEILSDFFGS